MQFSAPDFRHRIAGLLFALTWLSSVSNAQTTDAEDALASQRFHYQKAKTALAKQNIAEYQTHYQALGDYPLKQYLEFAELRDRFHDVNQEQIDGFLAQYPDSFLASRLRVYFLYHLAHRNRWQDFLHYYREDIASLPLLCHSMLARIKTGDKSAFTDVAEIWNVGKSQPKQCDPVFKAWREAGHQSEDIVLSRISKAISGNQMGLANYLTRFLTKNKSQADLFLQVHNKPSLITQRKNFQSQNDFTQQIISHGIKRLARRDPVTALYHWDLYEAQQLFSGEIIRDTKLEIVKRLIRNGHPAEAQRLLSHSHELREQDLVEELARDALREQDWERLAQVMTMLDEENRLSDRWQYWGARVQESLNRPFEHFAEPETIYRAIAQNRSFYGFLAADKLQQNYSLVDNSVPVDPDLLSEVGDLSAMRRAYELWLTGNLNEAKAEWYYLSRNLTDQQLLAAGQLARNWGWYNSGIQAMISGNFWNQLAVRFPIAYRQEVYEIANDTQLDPTLIYAIARQESAFDATARSPVGAMGLMQLMPKTAQFTAQLSGIKHAQKHELLDAAHNIRLGSHYLNHLLQKFNGNRILAAAAYNAGPHRVDRWLSPLGKERPVDVWIETIPFRETRHYVQNVLCFSVIYGYRLGVPTYFISEEESKRYL